MDLFSLFKEKVDDKEGDLLKIFSNLVEFFNSLPSYIDDKLPSLLLEGYQRLHPRVFYKLQQRHHE